MNEFKADVAVAIYQPASPQMWPLADLLRDAGYNVELHHDYNGFSSSVQASPPHLVVLDLSQYQSTAFALREFYNQINSLSDEIFVLLIGSPHLKNDTLTFLQGKPRIDATFLTLFDALEILHRFDRLFDRVVEHFVLQNDLQTLMTRTTKKKALSSEQFPEIYRFQNEIEGRSERDFLLQCYVRFAARVLGNRPVFFLRKIAHPASLILQESLHIDPRFKGLGISIPVDQGLSVILEEPESPLHDFVKSSFYSEKYWTLIFKNQKNEVGLFILLDDVEIPQKELLIAGLRILQSAYALADLQFSMHKNEIHTNIDGVYNRRYFAQQLEIEVARARRIQQPVSVVYFEFDWGHPQLKSLNSSERSRFDKATAQIVKKHLRPFDLVSKFDEITWAMCLPHTSVAQGELVLKRLVQLFERAQFKVFSRRAERPLTLGIGIAEYPRHGSDVETIQRLADASLVQSLEQTRLHPSNGSVITRAHSPDRFEPDFKVLNVEPL